METGVLREITPLGEHDFMYVADRHKKEFDYPIHCHEVMELNFGESWEISGVPGHESVAVDEAHVGDLYFLPAGRLHAIGAGNFLAEIQETSDMDKLFAEGQSQGGALTVAAAALSGRTFLAIAPAITFMGFFKKYLDKATGMGDTLRLNDKGEMINDSVYNLQGQRLTTRPTRGLYIHNRRSSSPQRVQGWSTVARCGRHRQ